jgi:hypothetical protein
MKDHMKTSTRITAAVAAFTVAAATLLTGGAANAAVSASNADAAMKYALYIDAENYGNQDMKAAKGTFKEVGVYGGTSVSWQRDNSNICYIATPAAGTKGSQAKWVTAVVAPKGAGDYKWSIAKPGVTTCAAAYASATITPAMATETEVFGLADVFKNITTGLTSAGKNAKGRWEVSGNFIQRINANTSKSITERDGVNPNSAVWSIVSLDYSNAGKGGTVTLNSKNEIVVTFKGGQAPAKQPAPQKVGLTNKVTVTGSVAPGTKKQYCIIVAYGHQYTKWTQDGKISTPANFVPTCVNGQ